MNEKNIRWKKDYLSDLLRIKVQSSLTNYSENMNTKRGWYRDNTMPRVTGYETKRAKWNRNRGQKKKS